MPVRFVGLCLTLTLLGSRGVAAQVYFDEQETTLKALRDMMDGAQQMPMFKRGPFGVCSSGELLVGDMHNGEGPGGLAYAVCPGWVMSFSFQGDDAFAKLLPLARRMAAARFAR